jgi:MFS transporter, SP family, galactose:H+ symporter
LGGSLTFGIFFVLAIVSFVFIYVLAPEIKGRQLEAIRQYWYNDAKWPDEVDRTHT